MTHRKLWLLLLLLPGLALTSDSAVPFAERADVRAWADALIAKHQLSSEWVHGLLAEARHRPQVIANADRPAESRPWHWYRNTFVTERRIRRGKEFIKKHAELLADAQRAYDVPPEIIAAILAAESDFGRNTGKHPILDSLLTLGFGYPRRADFFRGQLEHLLLLEREAGLPIKTLRGSWAGALGQAQFIPSSYRAFAIDGDQDGFRDLWDSPADIIFSIANYFRQHHWKAAQPVAERIRPEDPESLPVSESLLPEILPGQLTEAGIRLQQPPAGPVAVHRFDGKKETEYWVCHHNFYVITRYNHSALYALMIYQLSQAMRDEPGS